MVPTVHTDFKVSEGPRLERNRVCQTHADVNENLREAGPVVLT